MRTFYNGDGLDNTDAANDYLNRNRVLEYADLYVIHTAPCYGGLYLDKQFMVTNCQSPLLWGYRGRFNPALSIKRDPVESKIALSADPLQVTWAPRTTDVLATDDSDNVLLTVLQGFQYGIFERGECEIWRVVMPVPGDCDSLGAYLLWGGAIGDVIPSRLNVKFSVIPRIEALNQQVPTPTVEPTNIYAQYAVGIVPPTAAKTYDIASGSSVTKIYGDATPTMPAGTYDGGYLVFQTGKLAGHHARIRQQTVEGGHHAFYLMEPLPFAATIGDTFNPKIPVPRDYVAAGAIGTGVAAFPFVPSAVNSSLVIA